jgi:arsenate reductase (thioredoxin)
MKTVLFACVHNAGRSQMAAAFFNGLVDPAKARAISAGTDPAPAGVHPEVIAAMREVGFDLSAAETRRLTEALARDADYLITMGCGEQCPVVPNVRRDDWSLDDPKGKTLDDVRAIREQVRQRVVRLIDQEHWSR